MKYEEYQKIMGSLSPEKQYWKLQEFLAPVKWAITDRINSNMVVPGTRKHQRLKSLLKTLENIESIYL